MSARHVIRAIDGGHLINDEDREKPVCKKDQQAWPCEAIRKARKAPNPKVATK